MHSAILLFIFFFVALIGILTWIINVTQIKTVVLKFIKQIKYQYESDLPGYFQAAIKSLPLFNYSLLYDRIYQFYENRKAKLPEEYFFYRMGSMNNIGDSSLNLKVPLLLKKEWTISNNPNFQLYYELNFTKQNKMIEDRFSSITKEYTGYNDFMEFMHDEINNELYESETYNLYDLQEKEMLHLRFCKGSYSDYIRQYEAIGKETIYLYFREMVKKEKGKVYNYYYRLRNLLKDQIVQNYHEYPCSIGLNVFTIIDAGSKFYTLVQDRNATLPEHPKLLHVVPAGTFQPHPPIDNKSWEEQFYFEHTIIREFAEEMFDFDVARHPKRKSSENFLNEIMKIDIKGTTVSVNKSIADLLKIDTTDKSYKTGSYKIIPTSFSIDMMPVKPQISFVMHIQNSELCELLIKAALGSEYEGKVKMLEIDSPDFQRFVREHLNVNSFTPTGIIAFEEGYKYFQKYIKINEVAVSSEK